MDAASQGDPPSSRSGTPPTSDLSDLLYAAETTLLTGVLDPAHSIAELNQAEIEYTARQTTIQELGNDPFRPYNRAYNANLHDAAHSLGKCSVARNDPEYPICELVARTLARLQGMHRKLDQGWKDWDPVYTAGPASSCLAPWWRTQGSQTNPSETQTGVSESRESLEAGEEVNTISQVQTCKPLLMKYLMCPVSVPGLADQSDLTWLDRLDGADRAAHRRYLKSEASTRISDKDISLEADELLSGLCSLQAWGARFGRKREFDSGVKDYWESREHGEAASGRKTRFGRGAAGVDSGGPGSRQAGGA